jgi:hypothetical protein
MCSYHRDATISCACNRHCSTHAAITVLSAVGSMLTSAVLASFFMRGYHSIAGHLTMKMRMAIKLTCFELGVADATIVLLSRMQLECGMMHVWTSVARCRVLYLAASFCCSSLECCCHDYWGASVWDMLLSSSLMKDVTGNLVVLSSTSSSLRHKSILSRIVQ